MTEDLLQSGKPGNGQVLAEKEESRENNQRVRPSVPLGNPWCFRNGFRFCVELRQARLPAALNHASTDVP